MRTEIIQSNLSQVNNDGKIAGKVSGTLISIL
jgi:hypothetical protein